MVKHAGAVATQQMVTGCTSQRAGKIWPSANRSTTRPAKPPGTTASSAKASPMWHTWRSQAKCMCKLYAYVWWQMLTLATCKTYQALVRLALFKLFRGACRQMCIDTFHALCISVAVNALLHGPFMTSVQRRYGCRCST